jgi:hypothetical protein
MGRQSTVTSKPFAVARHWSALIQPSENSENKPKDMLAFFLAPFVVFLLK